MVLLSVPIVWKRRACPSLEHVEDADADQPGSVGRGDTRPVGPLDLE